MNKKLISLTESDLHRIVKDSVNRINEIGDTKDGQRLLGRTAERAWQRAQRTSGADKNRFMKTLRDAHNTAVKSSKKHLGGTGKYYYDGGDYEYGKWEDEHDGKAAPPYESKNVNNRLTRLTESDLHRIVKESVNRIIKENSRRTKKMIREFFFFNNYVDKKGHPIRVGSKVIWYDPEKSARDLKRVWIVDDMQGNIVYISDEFSEAEVYPQELLVVG